MPAQRNYRRTAKPPLRRRPLLWVVVAVLVIAVSLAVSELTDTTHIFHDKAPTYDTPTAGPATKGNPESKPTDNQSSEQSNNTKPTPDTSDPAREPTGNFVNDHRPAAGEQMESICNTTPGATCQIVFTKDSSSKALPVKKTDANGAVYWAWKATDIGLTPGSWTVTATAKTNSGAKSVSDTLTLEIPE